MQLDADAAAVYAWVVAIIDAPHIIHSQESEDVVETNTNLHIRSLAHFIAVGISRELQQLGVLRRVVFVSELAP